MAQKEFSVKKIQHTSWASGDNANRLISAVTAKQEPVLKLADVLALPYCGERDCYDYTGIGHLYDGLGCIVPNPQFREQLALRLADLIDQLPGLKIDYKNGRERMIQNAFELAATLGQPDVLQDPLERAADSGRFKSEKNKRYWIYNPGLIRKAIVANQTDRRHEQRWFEGIKNDRIRNLDGGGDEAFEAVMQMPALSGVAGEAPLDSIAQAGQIFFDAFQSRPFTLPSYAMVDKYLWPVAGRFGLKESFLDRLAAEGDNACWDPDVTRILSDFRERNIPKALEIAETMQYYEAETRRLAEEIGRGKYDQKAWGIIGRDPDYKRTKLAADAMAVYLRQSCGDHYPAVAAVKRWGGSDE